MYFLEHGHLIDEVDKYGYTCLHIASFINHHSIVEYVI